jgi:GntR family transcriptional regulator/MocR family aminotransferase
MTETQNQQNQPFSLLIKLDPDSFVPAYLQIAHALRNAILDGQLQQEEQLPSLNELANALSVSRSTVTRSFETLASQGYIKIHGGSGAQVCRKFLEHLDAHTVELAQLGPGTIREHVQLSAYGRRLLKISTESINSVIPELEIYHSGPALELTPLTHWKALLERNCRMKDLSRLEYSHEPFGYPPLREAYAAYLTRARAVRCSADQVVVFSARELRLDLVCRMLIDAGDFVAVEEPGYPDVRQRFESYGARVVAIRTDHDGLDVDYLSKLDHKFKLLYVSPSYVDPTGATLSLSRRHSLIKWAAENGTFIVEDDYASEYRYRGRPLPSLQGLDYADVVIHLSCLWKVLFPVLRLGFLIIPRCLLEAFLLSKALTENDLPLFDQFALTDFINDGTLERHIRKTRAIYGKRREALTQALKLSLGDRVVISHEAAGFELLINLQTELKDTEVLALARLNRIPLFSSQPQYVNSRKSGEFIVPFGEFDEDQANEYVVKLRALLG